MRTKDEKRILISKILVNLKGDPLYQIADELHMYNFSEEGALNDDEVKLPENRPIITDNLLNTELLELVDELLVIHSKLKLYRGLLEE